jgi:Lysophospholipase L1 and related esterases
MELVCLGDSLTFGYGVSSKQRWTNLAAQMSGWHIVNRGICGDTTGGMLVRLREELGREPAPDAVLLMGGANDIFFSGSAVNARANMGAMLHQVLAAGILPLAGIPTPIVPGIWPAAWGSTVDFAAAREELERYKDWLQRFCGAFGLRCVDFRPDFLDVSGNVDAGLFFDGLHPGPEGHRRMAERLTAVLRNLEGEMDRG